MTGRIIKLVSERGFGFLRTDDGTEVFFHVSTLIRGLSFDELKVGDILEFQTEQDNQKRLRTRPGVRRHTQAPSGTPEPGTPAAPAAAPSGTAALHAPYRFLNPYNFVRFLREPNGKPTSSATGGVGALLHAAYAAAGKEAPQQPQAGVADVALLGRCEPPPHDRHVGLQGRITCTLHAVTPLFVSNAEDVKPHGEHHSYQFFTLGGQPALPGSSLRGMVRSLFEAVSNSCVAQLTDARLSFHLPPAEALRLVPARVEEDDQKRLCLRILPGTCAWQPGRKSAGPQYAAWILRYLPPIRQSYNLPSPTPYGQRQVVPLNGLAHKDRCWALLEQIGHPRRKFTFWNVKQLVAFDRRDTLAVPGRGEIVADGFLCLTNQNIENKHDERFFFAAEAGAPAKQLPLSLKTLDDYRILIHDYQQRHADNVETLRAQGKDPERPHEGRREKHAGYSRFIVHEGTADLRDGDLVYASVSEKGKVQFLVPVSVPRAMYDRSIANLLPRQHPSETRSTLAPCHDYEQLCPACRVFGWVRQGEEGQPEDPAIRVAYAGRVVFSHGKVRHGTTPLPPTPLAILSSPKPTTTGFYLRPENGDIPEKWTGSYDTPTHVLRGRKFYRHHGIARSEEYYRAGGRCDDQNRTVRDALAPGAVFDFTVEFENLAPVELGALLWALELEQGWHHRLGFAKPLGFGSVKVKVEDVRLLDPRQRYTSLVETGWNPLNNWKAYVERFKVALSARFDKAFDCLPNVEDLQALLTDPPAGLPIHYPRTGHRPDPEGKNFEWFMGNNRYHNLALPPAAQDKGLPLITREGNKGL